MNGFVDMDFQQWCNQPLPSDFEPQPLQSTSLSHPGSTTMKPKKRPGGKGAAAAAAAADVGRSDGRLLPFPYRLHRMLEDVERAGKQDVVSWMPCGQSFKVHKISRFVNEIVPVYFNLTQYKSFKRQLINYGFVRIQNGLHNSKFTQQGLENFSTLAFLIAFY